jgi:sarcosine oxidase
MTPDWDAVVVGAGICGLAAAYELTRRGRRVVVLERGAVAGEQSAGLGRIFRIAHGQARLCALAAEARAGWRRWEDELGAGRLLGDEGFVSAGPRAVTRTAAAMTDAGAAWEALDRRAIAGRVPLLAADHPWEAGVFDPAGGSLRIRRAQDALARRLEIRRAAVESVDASGAVRLAGGARVTGAAVLVCAGARTPALAAGAGIAIEARFVHHVRLTYAARAGAACLAAPEGYGLPLGSTGRWAWGMHDADEPPPDADAAAASARERQGAWVPRVFAGLDPQPLSEVRCVSVHAPWLDDGGDGFTAARNGRAIAFCGANLMKLGPVIGDRLARSALDGGLHPDLRVAVMAR